MRGWRRRWSKPSSPRPERADGAAPDATGRMPWARVRQAIRRGARDGSRTPGPRRTRICSPPRQPRCSSTARCWAAPSSRRKAACRNLPTFRRTCCRQCPRPIQSRLHPSPAGPPGHTGRTRARHGRAAIAFSTRPPRCWQPCAPAARPSLILCCTACWKPRGPQRRRPEASG